MIRLFKKLSACAILLVFHLSCGDSPTSSVPTEGSIKVSIKSVTNGAPVQVLSKTSGNVTITSARVVIERIRFDSSVNDTLDFRFRDPFVQDLIAGSDLFEIGTVQVPFGSYKKSKIKIDDLGPEDGAVYTQNPDLQDRSVRIEGFMNGDQNQTFVFTSDLDKDQEREFEPPLLLDENSPSTSVVLTINMDLWFVDENDNALNPSLENNKSAIENNIKNSIDVFEDKDDDGQRDD